MRLPIYDKPRIICTADIFDENIALSRGCEAALIGLFSGTKTSEGYVAHTDHFAKGVDAAEEAVRASKKRFFQAN